MKKALLIVDVQNDFCPGGALAVENGNAVIPPLNDMARYFERARRPTFYSRDWHQRHTKHFAEFGGKWPVHCVQRTRGAEFHPDLWILKGAYILNKGVDPSTDGYSAFEGRAFACTFDELLREFGINDLFIGGLATDYCVKNSAIDARKLGYSVHLLTDACRAVNIKPTDETDALEEMRRAGVIFTTTEEVLNG